MFIPTAQRPITRSTSAARPANSSNNGATSRAAPPTPSSRRVERSPTTTPSGAITCPGIAGNGPRSSGARSLQRRACSTQRKFSIPASSPIEVVVDADMLIQGLMAAALRVSGLRERMKNTEVREGQGILFYGALATDGISEVGL